VGPFLGESFGYGEADADTPPRDDSYFILQFKIHGMSLLATTISVPVGPRRWDAISLMLGAIYSRSIITFIYWPWEASMV
jgi:hypothetical protein